MTVSQARSGPADVPAQPSIRALARAILALEPEDLAPAALRQAQWLLLDTIGCGIAGVGEQTARAVAAVAIAEGGRPECGLIGRPERVGVRGAVLANGTAVRVLDLNDYLIRDCGGEPEAGGHPSDNIPVALAMGAARHRTGAEILAAIVVGYEIYARLQRLLDRGGAWDGVTASGLVATAIAGRLMGLGEDQLAHALALGAARAPTPSIVRRGQISSAKSIANALVAEAGVQAALLADRGLTGPLAILDDPRGLRDLLARDDRAGLTAPFPAAGAILRAHIKAYPCVNTAQSAVAAALRLHAVLDGAPEELTAIEVIMADYPVIKRHQEDEGRKHPRSREAADHSFPFLVAVSLIDVAFGLDQFEGERWQDPRVTALMGRILLHRDAEWNRRAPGVFPCAIRARHRDGREFTVEVDSPPGLSQGELDANFVIEKFHAVTAPTLSAAERARIVDAVVEFPHSPSAARLEAALAAKRKET